MKKLDKLLHNFCFLAIALIVLSVSIVGCTASTTNQASHMYSVGNYASAADEYLKFIQENPKDPSVPEAFIGLAWSRYQMKEYFRAADAAEIMRSRYPGDPFATTATYIVAMCRFSERRYVEASNELREMIRFHPDDPLVPEARMLLARSDAALLRYASSEENFDIYLDKYGSSSYVPAALLGRAEVLIKQGKLVAAEESLQAMVDRFPNHRSRPEAILQLAKLKGVVGKFQEGVDVIEELLSDYPEMTEDRQTLELLADYYTSVMRVDKAAEIYKALYESVEEDSRVEEARYAMFLATYSLKMGDTNAARNYFRRLVDRFEDRPRLHSEALSELAKIEYSMNRYEPAIRYGERYLRLYSGMPNGQEMAALTTRILRKAGMVRSARNQANNYLMKHSNEAEAKDFFRVASLDIELGQYEQARENTLEGLARGRRAQDTSAILSGIYSMMIIKGVLNEREGAVKYYWELQKIKPNYITADEKIYWDSIEAEFYQYNRTAMDLNLPKMIKSDRKLAVVVAGFDFPSVDSSSISLATSLWNVFAAAVGARHDFELISEDKTQFIEELVATRDFETIPDTYFPLRTNIGTDWIIAGTITKDYQFYPDKPVELELRLLRIDYEGIFPFEYRYRFSTEEARRAAPEIVRETINKLVIYCPDR
ncbi:MAG: tetratricopeptide repeat protein [Candidatus Lindowbacteria bacterium]|nr:tetratricopeptide repeat protein [Candidatus Lindowbacteria bacterium]